jgi:pyruvate formate-lyase activating enzyme-like uncharacterized protein
VIFESQKSKTIELNRREYEDAYDTIPWVSAERALEAAAERREILNALSENTRLGFQGTKMDCTGLSPGCILCGEGAWSCLFVNQICNAGCFYCPTEQTRRTEPSTNGILFQNPREYVRYLERFHFRGASISGGEPFLTFDRTLSYLSEVRKTLRDQIYVWLYTNGIAVTRERLELLRGIGLDEVRFDISANRYDLSKVAMAVEQIGTVTVEVPAIPEDHERMKPLLGELKAMGVKHLNLHQLRCTPHNRENLIKRGYTCLHGPKVTVLDSELMALRLLRYAKEEEVGLPINYCSYVYKNRFQTAAQRKRIASHVCQPYEDITAAGAVRRMSIRGAPGAIASAAENLEREGCAATDWHMPGARDRLYFNQAVHSRMNLRRHHLFLDYFIPILNPGPSYRFSFKEIPLSAKKAVFVEKVPILKRKELTGDLLAAFEDHFLTENSPREEKGEGEKRLPEELEEIRDLEEIREGLQDYY